MTYAQKRGMCWLIAAGMTAAVMLFVLFCTEITFAANDDSSIQRAFLGYETGEPARLHIFIHGLLAQPLGWLGSVFPGLPWFSWLQLALLALAGTVIAKSIMQSFLKYGRPLTAGVFAAAVFELLLCMKYIAVLTFTQTAALLCAAAAAQLLSIEYNRDGRHAAAGVAAAAVLACLSYALRQDVLLPMLAFFGWIFLLILWENAGFGKQAAHWAKPVIVSAAAMVLALACMVGLRQLELKQPEVQAYLQWQEANTEIMDYTGMRNIPQEAFDLVDWDQNAIAMAERWCFLDQRISTEAFLTLNEHLHRDDVSFEQRLKAAGELFAKTADENQKDMHLIGGALAAVLLGLAAACVQRRIRALTGILGSLALAAAMILYLAYEGRLPLRAMLIAVLPCAAICFMLLPVCMPEGRRLISAVCGLVIAGVSIGCLAETIPGLLKDEQSALTYSNPLTDLEDYALYEPESLFLYDMSMTIPDTRVFPPYPEGVPHNVTFWGGWPLKSPQSIQQFANFGIDLMHFEARDLLRDNVFVASACIDPPPAVLLEWLRSEVSPNIDCELYAEYGFVYIFHFYEYDAEES